MRERQGHLNSRERDWQSERERWCSKRDKARQINEREGECERES